MGWFKRLLRGGIDWFSRCAIRTLAVMQVHECVLWKVGLVILVFIALEQQAREFKAIQIWAHLNQCELG